MKPMQTPQTDTEIAVFIRSAEFLERQAQLEKALQEAEHMLSAEQIAAILGLPVHAIESVMVGIAAQMVHEAGGDVLLFDPPPGKKN